MIEVLGNVSHDDFPFLNTRKSTLRSGTWPLALGNRVQVGHTMKLSNMMSRLNVCGSLALLLVFLVTNLPR